MRKKLKDMTYEEKTRYFASGRCTAGKVDQFIKGHFVSFYLPRVRGHYVTLSKGKLTKHKTPEAALKEAVKFRAMARERIKTQEATC